MKLFKQRYPGTIVAMVETGDFSADPTAAGRVKTRNLIEGMRQIGYDALNVGERDVAGGIGEFLELARESGLPFTNANFIYRDTTEPLFAPYVIKSYTLRSQRVVRLGFLGLDALNSAFAKEAPGGRIVIMRDPVNAARLYLPSVRRRADFVVLLANLSLRDLSAVLSAAPGLDLVLASHGARLSPSEGLERIGGVPVLYAGNQGKRMGEVRVTFGRPGDAAALMANQIWLTRRYPAEPKLQALIDQTIARVNDINRRDAERLASSSAATRASIAGPGYDTRPRSFLTAPACSLCHAQAYDVYMHSAHAHAFDTLVRANQDYNPECVKCHVTGYEQPQGFLNARQTPDLANVQCEACHGNASDHVKDPTQPYGDVPPRQCFSCHTKENSPDFVFFKYWDRIKH